MNIYNIFQQISFDSSYINVCYFNIFTKVTIN